MLVPMGWNWAVWFVQQTLQHLFPGGAEMTFHQPHTGMIDNFPALALSQVEADESLTRMLGRLETVGVVARVEPRTRCWDLNAVSGTCWRPSPRTFWRVALALQELTLADVVAATLSGMQCLCLDYDVNFTAFSSMRVNLRITSEDVWDVCGPLCGGNCAFLGHCSTWDFTVHPADASLSGMGVCRSRCAVHGGQKCWFNFRTWAIQAANGCSFETSQCFGRGGQPL